jgi:hypothetical protein
MSQAVLIQSERNESTAELSSVLRSQGILAGNIRGTISQGVGTVLLRACFKYFHVVKMPQCQRSTEKQASRCVSLLDLASSTRMC